VSLVWYGLTRLIQSALLIWLLVISGPELQRSAPFIIAVIVCTLLTGVQAYTFKIYAVRGVAGWWVGGD